jgi:hypothetical protein
MGLPGMGAGDEGVEPLDLVREAVLDEEIERAIGHRRLRAEPGVAQEVENRVGSQRAVFRNSSSSALRRTGVRRSPSSAQRDSAAARAASTQAR